LANPYCKAFTAFIKRIDVIYFDKVTRLKGSSISTWDLWSAEIKNIFSIRFPQTNIFALLNVFN